MNDPMNGPDASTHTAPETNTTSGERYSLGYMLNFANQMPMQNVVPWDNTTAGIGKCGTTWCLTDDSTAYLMYYPTGSSLGPENLTVNSSATTSTCEWFDIDTRSTSACTYQGTGSHSYTAPGTGPYVLFVH